MSDRPERTQPVDVDRSRVGLFGGAALGVVAGALVACGDADPRDVARDWTTANAACGADAVRRAYALERRRGDEDSLETRLGEAREKPCRANSPKPEVKEAALVDERGELAVVRVAYLHFPGSATSTERVVLVKSSDEWKVDTQQSERE
jgi:hypothetical protein